MPFVSRFEVMGSALVGVALVAVVIIVLLVRRSQ